MSSILKHRGQKFIIIQPTNIFISSMPFTLYYIRLYYTPWQSHDFFYISALISVLLCFRIWVVLNIVIVNDVLYYKWITNNILIWALIRHNCNRLRTFSTMHWLTTSPPLICCPSPQITAHRHSMMGCYSAIWWTSCPHPGPSSSSLILRRPRPLSSTRWIRSTEHSRHPKKQVLTLSMSEHNL